MGRDYRPGQTEGSSLPLGQMIDPQAFSCVRLEILPQNDRFNYAVNSRDRR
jgi:hypothetical protein